MPIISFLRKLRYGSYQQSSIASIYEKIASDYNVLPQHVYEIAHGKRAQDKNDRLIFDELVARGIIVNTFV